MKDFKLDNEPKIGTGFKIPERYFDDLHRKIAPQLVHKETPVASLFSKKRNWVLAAAAVFIIALGIPLVQYFNAPVNEIDNSTLENYLASRNEITNDDIAELLTEKDIQKIKIDLNIENQDIEDILTADANIEDYIID